MSADQQAETKKIILAVGAHAGDMEVSCGAALAKQIQHGDAVTLLHLTLGEGGDPKQSAKEYGKQKEREARAVASAMGADVIFGPYKDGELPADAGARQYVAEVIRKVKPTHVITHWRNSIHPDHANTSIIVNDAVLLASLESDSSPLPRHRGVRGIFFTENWEDPQDFSPYIYMDVSGIMESWKSWIVRYQFIAGGISTFPYLDYYWALARVRGAESGTTHAIAFGVDPFERKRVLDLLP